MAFVIIFVENFFAWYSGIMFIPMFIALISFNTAVFLGVVFEFAISIEGILLARYIDRKIYFRQLRKLPLGAN